MNDAASGNLPGKVNNWNKRALIKSAHETCGRPLMNCRHKELRNWILIAFHCHSVRWVTSALARLTRGKARKQSMKTRCQDCHTWYSGDDSYYYRLVDVSEFVPCYCVNIFASLPVSIIFFPSDCLPACSNALLISLTMNKCIEGLGVGSTFMRGLFFKNIIATMNNFRGA